MIIVYSTMFESRSLINHTNCVTIKACGNVITPVKTSSQSQIRSDYILSYIIRGNYSIFFENKKNKYLLEQTNFKAATIENQQKQLSTQMNGIQSNLMRMASQLYRLQGKK